MAEAWCHRKKNLRDASWHGVDSLNHLLVTVEDSDLAIGIDVEDDGVALDDIAREHALSHAVLQQAHDCTAERAGSIGGVVTLVNNAVLQ